MTAKRSKDPQRTAPNKAVPHKGVPKAASDKTPRKHRVSVLSFNLWHGLNHSNPLLMLPAENPIAAFKRQRAVLRALEREMPTPKKGESGALQVFLLQELNPIDRQLPKIARRIGAESYGYAVNVGLRLGRLSYPPFLQEGLGTFWRGPFKKKAADPLGLSGSYVGRELPFGIQAGIHLSERRGATLVQGTYAGLQIAFMNIHAHAGPSAASVERRHGEIEKAIAWADEIAPDADLLIFGGDFNANADKSEMQSLQRHAFEELSLDSRGQALATWDPARNPLCRFTNTLSRDPEVVATDSQLRSIDHIFARWKDGKKPKDIKVESRMVFDEAEEGIWLSDHIGVKVELTWSSSQT